MRIRSKLLLSYFVMLVALLGMGAASIRSILSWRRAAEKLSAIYAQGLRAERLRANMHRQIAAGLGFLKGDEEAQQDFSKLQEKSDRLLEELRRHADGAGEEDQIEGLDETQFELVWTINTLFKRGASSLEHLNLTAARARIQEIADEVTDDVAALNQYYREQVRVSLAAATRAGNLATGIIAAAAILATLQLFALAFLLERWLVRPIATVGRATESISTGNFDTRVPVSSKDEWGHLAQAVNEMARSLKTFQRRLATKERLAALGELASFAAHNIRNPLAGIRAAAQVALSELPDRKSEMAQSLEEIIESVDRLDIWVKRLLGYAKPLDFEPAKTDINDVVEKVASLALRPFAVKDIKLEMRLSGDLPPADVDPVLMEQALFAVATNAFEAVAREGRVEFATSYVSDDDRGRWLNIAVRDDGNGISPDLQSRVFQAFVSDKKGGIGLGLPQAKKIIEMHGGEIELTSNEGEGTEVRIRIPLRPSEVS